jgi:hypothetical protein
MPNERHDFNAVIDNGKVIDVNIPQDGTDVLVFQRVTHRFLSDAIPIIRKKYGIAVVIDTDDDLSRLAPGNPAFNALHPRCNTAHSWHNSEIACSNATLVTTSAPALFKRYAPHGRAVVINNHIPRYYYNIPHEDSNLVGYPGAVFSHSDDISTLGWSIQALMEDGIPFATIGDTTGISKILTLTKPLQEFGPVEVKEWPLFLSKLGIGVVPLANTEFNKSKSWLKPLELAAVGVPCVHSATGVEYNTLGIGWSAKSPKEYYTKVKRLATDRSARIELAAESKEKAREWILEENTHKWLDAWKYARQLQDEM